jgi:hypothetical protein
VSLGNFRKTDSASFPTAPLIVQLHQMLLSVGPINLGKNSPRFGGLY